MQRLVLRRLVLMPLIDVDPKDILRQPLVIHEKSRGELWLVVNGLVAGRLSKLQRSEGKNFWLWWLTGPVNEAVTCATFGDGESLPEAKAALATSLSKFVDAALLAGTPLQWHQ